MWWWLLLQGVVAVELLLPQPLVPHPCFQEIFAAHRTTACTDMDEVQRRMWAHELTTCHYRVHRRIRPGSGPFCVSFPANCSRIEDADTETFTIYSVFFTHVTEICMFYEGLVAHDRSLRFLEELQSRSEQSLMLTEHQNEHLERLTTLVDDVQALRDGEAHLRTRLDRIFDFVVAQEAAANFHGYDVAWCLLVLTVAISRALPELYFYLAVDTLAVAACPSGGRSIRAFLYLLAIFHIQLVADTAETLRQRRSRVLGM